MPVRSYARISCITFPWTSARRKSRPEYRWSVARGQFPADARSWREDRELNPIFDGFHAESVGGAVHHATTHTAAGHEHRKAGVMMIETWFLGFLSSIWA